MTALSQERVSAALREFDILEPWLSESHWDDDYWADEAAAIVSRLSENPSRAELRTAIDGVLSEAVGDAGLRPEYERLLDKIAETLRP